MSQSNGSRVTISLEVAAEYEEYLLRDTTFGTRGRGETKKAKGEKKDLYYARIKFDSFEQIVDLAIKYKNIELAKLAGSGELLRKYGLRPNDDTQARPVFEAVSERGPRATKSAIESLMKGAHELMLAPLTRENAQKLKAMQDQLNELLAQAEMMVGEDEEKEDEDWEALERETTPVPAAKSKVKK
jgi:hypothetical protein